VHTRLSTSFTSKDERARDPPSWSDDSGGWSNEYNGDAADSECMYKWMQSIVEDVREDKDKDKDKSKLEGIQVAK
jgi:hypothetical protein